MKKSAAILAILSLAVACGSDSSPTAPGEPIIVGASEVQLRAGESREVGDLRVTFDRVTNESRCPNGVVCAWAGDAAVQLTVRSGNEERTPLLHTHADFGRYTDLFGRRIYLADVSPYPEKDKVIAPASYVVLLKVGRP